MLSGTVPAVVADWWPVVGVSVAEVLRRLLRLAAVVLASYGAYALLPAVLLGETPVELEVRERPTVNLVQEESWVEPGFATSPNRGRASA